MRGLFAGCAMLVWATCALGSNVNGQFDPEAVGAFVQHPVRPHFRLDQSFSYRAPDGTQWTAPAGEVVDGASIPRPAWAIIGGPFDGGYLWAAIIHDYYCCSKSRDWGETHDIFWRGMLAMGVPPRKASLMWAAVWYMGPDKWQPDPSVDPTQPCNTMEDHQRLALETQYDRMDDRGRRIAVAKFTGMVRTMNATGGRVLDVVDGRLIFPNTPEAKEHLDNLYRAMRQNFDFPRDQLGLISALTDDDGIDLSEVAPWSPGQIEALDTYMAQNSLEYSPPRIVDGKSVEPALIDNPFNADLSQMPEAVLIGLRPRF